ncbi:L-threonine 3-dehydrogenase [Coprinellus micaceus]|uniref:L-threonine 3-dehydrogenase n=1 Tax=Coprinellus micaceus TaxID=71717 RepID=A0A4Y7TF24_COPMI|nr:L-threonine 3-dehydrogenase [Coprinellus micaceus]
MKAARYYGPGEVRVDNVEVPVAGHGQVKIKTAWNALSATDVHMFSATLTTLAPTASKPNKLTGEKLPITMGHQFSGTIVDVGSGVDASKWKRGQKVAVALRMSPSYNQQAQSILREDPSAHHSSLSAPLVSCLKETCIPCTTGRQNVCPKATFIGIGGRGGGLAEYVSVNVQNVHHLPANVTFETGAMLESLAVAYHAVKRCGYSLGQTALVSGAGTVGLLIVKVLRSIDPDATIIVSEPNVARRTFASRYGATVVDPISSQGIVLARVYGETLGVGVDVAFETAGTQTSFDSALMCVKPHGSIVNIAIWQQSPNVNINLLNAREIALTGIMGYGGEYPTALRALATGRISGIEDLVTKKIQLQDVVQEGLLPLLVKEETEVGILVQPY